jgi:tRNA G10  N-methylase Trm11
MSCFHPLTSRPACSARVFPLELPRRLIQLYTYVDDIVLDPFLGSGTSCMVAKMLARKSIGFEINKNYRKTIEARLEEVKTLNFDPAGIQPNGRPLEDRFGPFHL